MKLTKLTKLTLLLALSCIVISAKGNTTTNDTTAYHPIGGIIGLENVRLWRGIEITDELNLTSQFFYRTKDDNFEIGVWGGAGVTGKYKEFDYYASYRVKGIKFALWDIYNFSGQKSPNVFDYNPHTTTHLIDLSATYQLPDAFPLKVYWSTIITGHDRAPRDNENRYSTYIELTYPILRHKFVDLNVGISGAFAFNNGREKIEDGNSICYSNLYSDHPGIVDITLTASRVINFGKYKLPLSLTSWWNPQKKYGNLLVNATIFSF